MPVSSVLTRGYGTRQNIIRRGYALPVVSSASFSVGPVAFSSEATSSIPTYSGYATLSARNSTFLSFSLEAAIYQGQAALFARQATSEISAVSLALYSGDAILTAKNAVATVTTDASVPYYRADSSLHSHPVLDATVAFFPTFTGVASMGCSHPILSAFSREGFIFSGSSVVSWAHPDLIVTSEFAMPVYHGSAVISAPIAILDTFALNLYPVVTVPFTNFATGTQEFVNYATQTISRVYTSPKSSN